jgi:2-polyprenyl-3-methyl-5-hydroxy-6-metoxy-1,4-benzoquinol methylase
MKSDDGKHKVSVSYHTNVRTDVLHLCDKKPGRILDVGGGIGATAVFIKEHFGGEFVALIDRADGSPEESVDLFVPGEIEDPRVWDKLDEAGGTFDTILCLDVLEHLVDPWSVVQKCSERLSAGGTLIVSVPNARYHGLTFPLFFKGRFRLQNSGILDRTHLRWFVKQTARELVTCGGLELEDCSGGWYLNRSRFWERLAKFGIAPGFLFLNYYLKARRSS